jgi:O-antigen/teichoic acid export membrane protein
LTQKLIESPVKITRVAADSSLAFIFKITSLFLAYGAQLIMAWHFGAGAMGTYFIAVNLVGILTVVCTLGLDVGLLRFVGGGGSKVGMLTLLKPALGITVLLACLTAAALHGLKQYLGHWFHSPHLPVMIEFFAISMPLLVGKCLVGESIRGRGGARWVVFQNDALMPFVFLVFLALIAYGGFQPLSADGNLGLAFLGKTILGLLFLTLILLKVGKDSKPAGPSGSFRSLVSYSWPIYLTAILSIVSSMADIPILGLFRPPEQVAYYGVAIKIALLVSFPLLAVNAVVPPLFARYHQQGNMAILEELARTTARWMYLAALPMALLIVLLSPQLLGLFGPDFQVVRFSLIALVMGQLANVGLGSVGSILNMTGHQWELLKAQLLLSAVCLPLTAFTAYAVGLVGVVATQTLYLVGLNLLMTWSVWRCLQIKAAAQGIWRANLGGLVGAALFYLLRPYVGYQVAALAFTLGYLAVIAQPLKEEWGNLREHIFWKEAMP